MTDGKKHHNFRNLTGQVFGMLTAIQPDHTDGVKWYWEYKCQCGKKCVRCGQDVTKDLKKGRTANCGCMTKIFIGQKNTTHGMTHSPLWVVWRNMRMRCMNPQHEAYKNYGARGISVCKRWQNSFLNFMDDMGSTYTPGLDLDRKNNEGDYTPKNCRWVTRRENVMNKRNTVRTVDVALLSEQTGIGRTTLYNRIKAGWPVEQLTRKPAFSNRRTT